MPNTDDLARKAAQVRRALAVSTPLVRGLIEQQRLAALALPLELVFANPGVWASAPIADPLRLAAQARAAFEATVRSHTPLLPARIERAAIAPAAPSPAPEPRVETDAAREAHPALPDAEARAARVARAARWEAWITVVAIPAAFAREWIGAALHWLGTWVADLARLAVNFVR